MNVVHANGKITCTIRLWVVAHRVSKLGRHVTSPYASLSTLASSLFLLVSAMLHTPFLAGMGYLYCISDPDG
jgi:hypothetical protein